MKCHTNLKQTLVKLHDISTKKPLVQTNVCVKKMGCFSQEQHRF
uniref:Uncharacterized protein n=1 Tax=Arundo donax TaxID=35708 RepID=A0A0A9H8G0_ARUDO